MKITKKPPITFFADLRKLAPLQLFKYNGKDDRYYIKIKNVKQSSEDKEVSVMCLDLDKKTTYVETDFTFDIIPVDSELIIYDN